MDSKKTNRTSSGREERVARTASSGFSFPETVKALQRVSNQNNTDSDLMKEKVDMCINCELQYPTKDGKKENKQNFESPRKDQKGRWD